ncbi:MULTISPECIES: TetR/AcrR family transcriptional regulator [Mycolicibacterium]|uniref:Transcriptional regulator, TetR family n=3 Tax=Mycolicibacterium gilvum TaxID=1804 RepID=E6TA77_MYCSR|nr:MULTISPECIES: TetR/AcrR family transcriptional regulator [Mycolicibacterium]ABP44782.1 transcriptional regulator, TetR family [Mycolicibacterium gilvum PYR-GCK]ADT98401.1 transcriptional regulator, TetR family [Mycolicibacterium gilvum Spyr1]MBV5245721.1 TetR/AcrR family transcriptional regulator [Mycolicibacterium sp. PAM1]MCV7057236.1 TetR/AcrR family transcriptional regulator [Mycolicibacterium gilvum]STZ44902.1 TetR family transcriptional regulator [Mycolicibacterium gilvum]
MSMSVGAFANSAPADQVTSPVADPPVEPKARTVRDRLIDAAEQCLTAKGIRATTVSEVAEVAGVSRGWLYRHFPDKSELLGAAIVRLNDAFWTESRTRLDSVTGLDEQIAAGVALARKESETPGALVLKLRQEEPEAFTACVGLGVRGLIPEIAAFWEPYIQAAVDRGEIHADTDRAEAAEWIARITMSLATVPGEQCDVDDHESVLRHARRYIVAAFRSDPAGT